MRAIGSAAVVNLLAHFYLGNCGAWIRTAAQPIAGKPARYEERDHRNPRSEQPWLRNGPQDRRLDQNHRGRCAAHRR